MRPFLSLVLLLTWATAVAAQGNGFDLKGVALGASESDITARFPGVTCSDRSAATVERMCAAPKETYGGADASIFFALLGGKVSNMSARFSPRDFPNVVAAMKERFGSPSSEESETVTNRMGAKFENQVVTWRRAGEIVVARRYSGSLDRSSVTFLAEASIDEFKRRSRDDKRQRAKDL